MADKTDDLVIGVSTDMSSVQRALKRLGSDVDAATVGIERSFTAASTKIDRSMSSIQDMINRVTGVAKQSGREWTGALAVQGKAMEELRAKFDPVFAAAQQFKRELGELNNAYSVGAIGADVYGKSLDELVLKHDRAEASARRLKAEYAGIAASERLSATSADGQSMWNTYAGVGAGSGNSARESASAFLAELERMERLAAQKAVQIGQAFTSDLEARLVPGTRSSAREAASAFEAEFARLDEIARLKAQQAGMAFQTALNASFRFGAGQGGAASSAAAFEELERKARALRAAINPLAAAQDMYNAELAEYTSLASRGAIAADELAAAQALAKQRLDATTAALNKQGGGKGATRFESANIAAQLQDIAVMTQMGIANPLTIALQQGTQLSAVFNQMGGTRDIISGIGTAFLSIVNPVSLVTIGTIAAGVAAYNYFSASEDGAEATKKALQEQEDLIRRVAQRWGEILPHIRAVAAEQDRLAGKLDIETTTQQELTKVFEAIGEQVRSTREEIDGVSDLLSRQLPVEQYSLLNSTLVGLTASAGKSKTTVEDMAAAHKLMSDLFRQTQIPVFRETADAIAGLIPGLADVRAEMDAIAARDAIARQFNDLQAAIASVDSAKARDELQKLMDQAKTGEISVADLLSELAKISSYAPDVSGIISAFRTVAEAADAARKSASLFTGKASTGGPARYQSDAVTLPVIGPTPTERGTPELGGFPWEDFGKKRGSGGKAPKRTADDRFFEDIEAIKQRTIALAEERAQLGLSYEAQQKRRAAFDLEQKALKDVREAARQKGDQDWQNAQLTPEQLRQIDEVSAAYARQAAELRRAQEQSGFAEDALYGLFSDIVPAIETGNKALDNFLAKLVEVGLQALLLGKGPFADLFGGGLLNFAGVGAPDPWSGLRLPGHSSGTANTGGRRGEPRGIVHGQEAVIPLPNGGRVPVQIQTPQMPALVSPSVSANPSINYAPVYNVAQGADPKAIAALEQAQAKDRAEFSARVVKTIRGANSSRQKFG